VVRLGFLVAPSNTGLLVLGSRQSCASSDWRAFGRRDWTMSLGLTFARPNPSPLRLYTKRTPLLAESFSWWVGWDSDPGPNA
jgi:hypothetical protein